MAKKELKFHDFKVDMELKRVSTEMRNKVRKYRERENDEQAKTDDSRRICKDSR